MSSAKQRLWGGVLGVALGVVTGCHSVPSNATRDIPAGEQTRAELGIYQWHFVVDRG